MTWLELISEKFQWRLGQAGKDNGPDDSNGFGGKGGFGGGGGGHSGGGGW